MKGYKEEKQPFLFYLKIQRHFLFSMALATRDED